MISFDHKNIERSTWMGVRYGPIRVNYLNQQHKLIRAAFASKVEHILIIEEDRSYSELILIVTIEEDRPKIFL